jgi:hypothetical protein
MLVFYVGNILVDKNTLCNYCILNRFIDFIQNLQVIWIVFVSSHVTGHKFLEDVHEEIPCNFQVRSTGSVQPSGRAFEGIWTPLNV